MDTSQKLDEVDLSSIECSGDDINRKKKKKKHKSRDSESTSNVSADTYVVQNSIVDMDTPSISGLQPSSHKHKKKKKSKDKDRESLGAGANNNADGNESASSDITYDSGIDFKIAAEFSKEKRKKHKK